ncbi:hypothetical protein A2783_03470 [Microgenomates group bacterium RIFCSPHIGHO2_01_FULL_45_11]|nr:MAG: hypothetical protein A2783_03470 [Microgenomates group bacterium RIFCSPHIGHO2_01_FULL_45_11]
MLLFSRLVIALVVGLIFFSKSNLVRAVGELVINEFVPNPSEGNEWIEIYYTGSEANLSLDGYWFDDDATLMVDGVVQKGTADSGSDPIELTGIITPGNFLAIDLGGNPVINNSGDTVAIFDPAGNLIDSYSFSETVDKGFSFGRTPDGSETWTASLSPTYGAANQVPSSPTPTPAPSPTVSPTAKTSTTSKANPTPTTSSRSTTLSIGVSSTPRVGGVSTQAEVEEVEEIDVASSTPVEINLATPEVIEATSAGTTAAKNGGSWWWLWLGGALITVSVVGFCLKRYNNDLWRQIVGKFFPPS